MKEFNILLEECIAAFNKTKELIPYSANKPNIDIKEWPSHRDLLIQAKRKNNPELSNYRKLICQLNLYIGDDVAPPNFFSKKVLGSFDGNINPNMGFFYNKLNSVQQIQKTHHKDKTPYELRHFIENSAKNAIKFGIGNCGEHADLTFALLLECKNKKLKRLKILVEYMKSGTGDHAYAVVNRIPGTKLSNLHEWGQYALIVDGWDGDIMYASTGKSIFNPPPKRYYDYYNYIKNHKPMVIECGYIGDGLSKRYVEHIKIKHRPSNFSLWAAKYTGNTITDKKAELHIIPKPLQDKISMPVKKIIAELERKESLNSKKPRKEKLYCRF